MTAEQMHVIIDEHRDAPRIVPGTAAALQAIGVSRAVTETKLDEPASPGRSEAGDGATHAQK